MSFKNNFNGSTGVTVKNRTLIKKRAAPNFSDKRLTKPSVKETLPVVCKTENVKCQPILLDAASCNVEATIDHEAENVKNENKLSPLPVISEQTISNVDINFKDIVQKSDDFYKKIVLSHDKTPEVTALNNINCTVDKTLINDIEKDILNSILNIDGKDVDFTSVKPSNELNPKGTKIFEKVQSEEYLNIENKISDSSDTSHSNVTLGSPLKSPISSDPINKTASEVQHSNKFIRRRAAPSVKTTKPKAPLLGSPKAPSDKLDNSSETSTSKIEQVNRERSPNNNEKLLESSKNQYSPFKKPLDEAKQSKSEIQPNKSLRKRAAPSLASKSIPYKKPREVNGTNLINKKNINQISEEAVPTDKILDVQLNKAATQIKDVPPNFLIEQKSIGVNVKNSSIDSCAAHEENATSEQESVTSEQEKKYSDRINVPITNTLLDATKEPEKNVERVIRVYLNSWPKYPRSDPFSDEPDHDLRTIRECGSISIWKQNKYHIAFCDLMEPIDLGKTPKNWAFIHLNKPIKEEIIDPDYEVENSEQICDQIDEIESHVEPIVNEENEFNVHTMEKDDGSEVHSDSKDDSESNNTISILSQSVNVIPLSDSVEPKVDTLIQKEGKCKRKRKTKPVDSSDDLIVKDKILPPAEEKVTQKKSKVSPELKKTTRKSIKKRDKENISSSSSENVNETQEKPKKKMKPKSSETLPEVKANNGVLSFGQMSSMIKSKLKVNDGAPPDQAKLSLKDFIIYVPPSEPMKTEPLKNEDQEENETQDCEIISEQSDVPKLIIRDGEIVVDPSSTMIKRTPIPIRNEPIEKYRKNNDNRDLWDVSDTIKFYRTLWKFGIDFSMITSTFPDKSRIAIKRKFKFEQKHHSSLVDYVLSGRNVDFKSVMRQLIIISGNEAIRKKKLLKKESPKPVTTPHFLVPAKKKPAKRGRKPKKQMDQKEKSKKQAVLKKLFDHDPSEGANSSFAEIIISEDVNTIDLNDIITFSTNLVYDNMNIVESVSFNPSNIVQPVDFNVTISHDPKQNRDPDYPSEEISSTSVIQM